MNEYTVIVRYPPKRATRMYYVARVAASSPEDAERAGCLEAMRKQSNEDRGSIGDWEPVITLEGWSGIARYGWQTKRRRA